MYVAIISWITFAISAIGLSQVGAKSSLKTWPQAPKDRVRPYEEWNIANFIPRDFENFRYSAKGKAWGREYYKSEIPLVVFGSGGVGEVGKVQVGQQVELKAVRRAKGRNFYAIELPEQEEGRPKKFGWIDGMFIKVEGPKN